MTYALSYDVPADEDMYRQVKAHIGEEQPPGLIALVVVHADHGLRHIGVWDSEADWQRFHDERRRARCSHRARRGRLHRDASRSAGRGDATRRCVDRCLSFARGTTKTRNHAPTKRVIPTRRSERHDDDGHRYEPDGHTTGGLAR